MYNEAIDIKQEQSCQWELSQGMKDMKHFSKNIKKWPSVTFNDLWGQTSYKGKFSVSFLMVTKVFVHLTHLKLLQISQTYPKIFVWLEHLIKLNID